MTMLTHYGARLKPAAQGRRDTASAYVDGRRVANMAMGGRELA